MFFREDHYENAYLHLGSVDVKLEKNLPSVERNVAHALCEDFCPKLEILRVSIAELLSNSE